MADIPSPKPEQVQPNCDFYPIDENFPLHCNVDYKQAYCCQKFKDVPEIDQFVNCISFGEDSCETAVIGPPGCHMVYPFLNDDGQPMLKTALNGTTMSAWVKIAFQQYCGTQEDVGHTAETILTMGNVSQPFNDEKCKAIIKSFQYGWGNTNQGNTCRITILDQKGSEFQAWTQRMGINPEGDSTPVQGKYRMKVQWGWYLTGGGDADICGQPAMPIGPVNEAGDLPITQPNPGFNSAFIICSPVLYFIPTWINVQYEQGKFIYQLEGQDLLERGQQQMINQIFGGDMHQIYFTKAVELLGKFSFPPFRVEFLALDANGDTVPLQFSRRDNNANDREFADDGYADCLGYGPLDTWRPDQRPPLAVIQEWLKKGVVAFDQTGKVTSNKSRVGITMNYDPTYRFDPKKTNDPCATCTSDQPQYGRLLVWASSIPYCQGNFTDTQLNNRMKAIYIVNGGNCSPVLHFAPSFKFLSTAAKAAGLSFPSTGNQTNQVSGMVKAGCAIASSPGSNRQTRVPPTDMVRKVPSPALTTQETAYHHYMTNLGIGFIEADLRVQGDPSFWLCTPCMGNTGTLGGMGSTVGIVFINPYFLVHGEKDADCPVWAANDPDSTESAMKSICNEMLTSKGWFVMGADHQIKEGQYITTLKLKLIAPGVELNPTTNPPTSLGGWAETDPSTMPYGGQGACLNKYIVGNRAAAWGQNNETECPAEWIGGGQASPCGDGYFLDPNPPPD